MFQAVCVDLVFAFFVIKDAVKLTDHAEGTFVLLQLFVVIVESADWEVLIFSLRSWDADAPASAKTWGSHSEFLALFLL